MKKLEPGHTPGPWRRNVRKVYVTIEELDCLIAEALGGRRLSLDQAEANAELIADAPELLRLLHAAYRALRSCQHGNGPPEFAQQVADEIEPLLTWHGSATPGPLRLSELVLTFLRRGTNMAWRGVAGSI